MLVPFLWSDTCLVSRKMVQRLAVSHAVPPWSREVAVAFNFVSECTVLFNQTALLIAKTGLSRF
jgi:hypothetical protein